MDYNTRVANTSPPVVVLRAATVLPNDERLAVNGRMWYTPVIKTVRLTERGCFMQEISDTRISDSNAPPKSRRVFRLFYFATICLLLGAIVFTCIQRQRESARTIAIAKTMAQRSAGIDAQPLNIPNDAKYWTRANLITFVLAILSLGMTLWHREKHRRVWGPVIVLFAFYVLLQFLIV